MNIINPLWSHHLHQRPEWRSVILSSQVVLALERQTRLVRLDPSTGFVLWEARVHNPYGWLAASDSAAFYLNQHTWFQCFDLKHGMLLWEGSPGGTSGIFGFVVPLENAVLIGGWRGYTSLFCLEAGTGSVRWQWTEKGHYALPLSGPWGIAVPCLQPLPGEILFVAPETGRVFERIPLPPGARQSEYYSSLQRYENGLLLTTREGHMYLLEGVHARMWRLIGLHHQGMATIQPTLLGQSLLFRDLAGHVCAYDLRGSHLNWTIDIPQTSRAQERLPAIRLLHDSTLIGEETSGCLMVIDTEGNRLITQNVGKRIRTNISSIGSESIVFGTSGSLVAYQILSTPGN